MYMGVPGRGRKRGGGDGWTRKGGQTKKRTWRFWREDRIGGGGGMGKEKKKNAIKAALGL